LLNHLLSANQDKRASSRDPFAVAARGERVLDLCCGTGDLSFECLRASRDAWSSALTSLYRCCNGANKSKRAFQISIFRFEYSKAAAAGRRRAATTFADAAFDVATVGFGVRYFEVTRDGLCEIARVLKPGVACSFSNSCARRCR
jgi:demethylmenaquinone methyltransferase/2-methoxy-6-polyprenyl-1,4-benzoquinol methylase